MTSKDQTSPLPCPFCGTIPEVNSLECRVQCHGCEAEIALWDGDDAVAAWNCRARGPAFDAMKEALIFARSIMIAPDAGSDADFMDRKAAAVKINAVLKLAEESK